MGYAYGAAVVVIVDIVSGVAADGGASCSGVGVGGVVCIVLSVLMMLMCV